MATAIKELHDDFLSCIICTDLYKDPCTLVCGHTFCRGCLEKYTKTQQDAIKTKSIRCPNCRQMTKVTNCGGPVEDWVKEIKPSFLIQGLLDRFTSQSIKDIAPENSCFSCLQHDVTTPGTSHCMDCDIILCDKCVKTHQAIPGTSNHVIADLGGKIEVSRKKKFMCKSHNCVVELFCEDCQKPVCHKCYILDHRKCDNVFTIESMVPTLMDTIDINIESDEETPDPVDITVVNVDGTETLAVTDYYNACVKSFYTMKQQARHSSLKLNSEPSSVTRLVHNQVAVSFYSHKQIVIVKVTPNLVLLSNITTQKEYRCLTALNDSTLAGGSHYPPSLDILDMTGRVLRSIIPSCRIKIKGPRFLCTTNDGNILVSDDGAESVYCLTPKGDIVFNYSSSGDRALRYPRGITISVTGDILVADWTNSRLIQLTSTGHFVRDILTSQDGIDGPCGVCLHKHKLYVALEGQQLKVYRVTRKLKLSK